MVGGVVKASSLMFRRQQLVRIRMISSYMVQKRRLAEGFRPPPYHCFATTSSFSSDKKSKIKDEALAKTAKEEWHWAPYVVVALLGSIGAWFWRASRSQSNREAALKKAEEKQILAKAEREELRKGNPQLTSAVLTDAGIGCIRHFGSLEAKITYPEFIKIVSAYLEAPLESGHLIDRVVISWAVQNSSEQFDLGFLLVALALAFPGDLDELAKALANILANSAQSSQGSDLIPKSHLIRLVDWLDQTGHVPPSALVVDTPPKYPAQNYTLKSSQRLVDDALAELKGDITTEENGQQFDSNLVAVLIASPTLSLV